MFTLNFAQKVADDPSMASVVLTGVVIVFGMLLLFVFVFSMFGVFSKFGKKSKAKTASKVKSEPNPVKHVKSVKAAPIAVANDDDEVIAVIAAAVYSLYEGTGKRPIIRSIKPARSSGRSAWATAGLMNNIKSF